MTSENNLSTSYSMCLLNAIVCVLWSLHQYPVSGKFWFQSDSRFNYLATIQCWPDSENPYLVHPYCYPTNSVKAVKEHLTTQQQQQPFYGPLSGTTRVSRYQKKHSPTHNPDHRPIFISFFHLPRSIASSLFKLRAWQSFCNGSNCLNLLHPIRILASTAASASPSTL